ncbi:MAG: outer membrane lipoprotein-sorting protein [Candidatus Bipolaricaulia bacterium]
MFNRYSGRIWGLLIVMMGLGLTLGQAQIPDDPNGQDVLACARSNLVEGTFHGTVNLKLIRPDFTTTYVMEMWTSGGDRALIRIQQPEDEAGSAYLQKGNNLWFYDPEAGQPVSLPESALSENFLGADLSLQDFYQGTLDESFNVELLGTRDASADESDEEGDQLYQVRLTPKPDAAVVYGKIEMDVRGSDCAVLRFDYYDQRDSLIRQATFSEFVTVENGEGSRVYPLKIVFDDLTEEGNRTVQRIKSYEFNVDLPDNMFTRDCLANKEACGSS